MKTTKRAMMWTALGASAALAFPGAAWATVTVTAVNGSPQQTSALTNFMTHGDQMVGMIVKVTYADATTQTTTWAALTAHDPSADSGSGAATVASFFSLTKSGDTHPTVSTLPWIFTNTSTKAISSLFIDAGPGDTVFDRTLPTPGTPGSNIGQDFEFAPGNTFAGNITATYSDIVNLTGSAAVGDLYRKLNVAFTGTGGLAAGSAMQFFQDTDNILIPGDIGGVPLPASFWMGLPLLGGLALVARRQYRRAVPV